ncbi:MAG: PSP1 domain-containing protein [Planctomycetota bacterium]|jgi:cell fate regulator YaaT (PSP1 superfamily)
MSKAAQTKPKQARHKKLMLVRYSRMNSLGLFEHHETRIPKVNTRVVIKTNKGLELGYLVGQLSSYRAGQLKLDSNQIKKYFDDSNIDISIERAGKFVRYATAADVSEERHLQKIAEEEMECCRRFVKELDLPMKIVDAEHIFGGERVIFYFMSDGRVDFRELVKKIAHEYQTRIEMRQIGSRDEAKILGDVESCGQQCCCQRFLKLLKPVNMRMAKMQKATLDPSKISGYCGRLKCCLRYEDKTYTELKKRLPKKNARVKTKYGEGKVTGTQILTQLVIVELDDGPRVAVPLDELKVISSPVSARKKKDTTAKDNQQENVESKDDSQIQDSAAPPEQ